MGEPGPGGRQLSKATDRLDEDDIRVRARPGSRPRTRQRPAYKSAPGAFVVSVDRGRYGCVLDDAGAWEQAIDVSPRLDELVAAVRAAPGRVVLVSAEVGLGVVPGLICCFALH